MPHYSLYLLNDAIVNPAILSSKNENQVSLMIRDQWTGFEGAPKTQALSYYFGPLGKFRNKFSPGVSIVNDVTGPISSLTAIFSGSYIIFENEENNRRLSLGACANILQYKMDNSQIILEDDGLFDPAFQSNIDKSLAHSATLGAYYFSEKYYLGASVLNVFSSDLRMSNTGVPNKLVNHYYINSSYLFDFENDIKMIPSVMFKKIGASPLQLDVNLKALFNDAFWTGVSYRTNDAIIAMLGFDFSQYSLGYSYDITTTNMSIPSYGSHGVFLSYKFNKQDKPLRPIPGCTDSLALNYDSLATIDDSSCIYLSVRGCMDTNALNYDSLATIDDGSCKYPPYVYGCTDSTALNYDPNANVEDGSCIYCVYGCMDSTALNYNRLATCDDGSCIDRELPPILEAFRNVQFGFNLYEVPYPGMVLLDKAGYYLALQEHIRIRIVGHTDHIHTKEYNIDLSRNRVNAVKKYLVDRGTDEDRIEIDFKGEEAPYQMVNDDGVLKKGQILHEAYLETLSKEDEAKARQYNRRVEIEIIEE